MKKYKLVSFVFILSLFLLGFSFGSASAYDSGCLSGDLFSRTTGNACSTTTVTACNPGDLFSSVTGQQCSGTNTTSGNTSVPVAQFNSLNQTTFTIGSRGTNVTALQQFLQAQGYYTGKIDGKYGSITARAVSDFQTDNNLNSPTTTLPTPATTIAPTPTVSTNTLPAPTTTIMTMPATVSTSTTTTIPNSNNLSANQTSLNFSAQVGVNPPSQSITVSGCPMHGCLMGGSASIPASGIVSWISVASSNDNTGTVSGTYTVSANVSNASTANGQTSLPAGTYNGYITFSVFGSNSQPLTIPVTLTVTGSTTQSTYPSGCTSASGYSWTTGDACDGSATITPTVNVTANPQTISSGGASTISWSSVGNNLSCSIYPSAGLVSASGSQVVYPTATTSYAVTCTNLSGVVGTTSATVYVTPTTYLPGCSSTSGWSSTTGQSCSYLPGCSSALGYSSVNGNACDGSTPPVPTYPSGCTSNSGYSSTTGYACNGSGIMNPSLLPGCASTSGWSSVNGNACNGSTAVQPTYPSGCTSTYGYSSTNGLACNGSGTMNPSLLPGCTSTYGYSSLNGNACDGSTLPPAPTPTYPAGCSSNSGYSSVNGNSCAN